MHAKRVWTRAHEHVSTRHDKTVKAILDGFVRSHESPASVVFNLHSILSFDFVSVDVGDRDLQRKLLA